MTLDSDQEVYLAKFSAVLRRLDVEDATGIVADVRGHIGEAIADGLSPQQTLSALGSPHTLARAYAVELMISNVAKQRWNIWALTKLASLLIGVSILSLALIPLLSLFAFTFLVTGALSFVFAVIELLIVDLPFIQNDHFSPLGALGASIPIFGAGCLFAWLLWRYLRYLVTSLRCAIAPLRAPSDT